MATDVPKLLLHSNYDEPHLILPQEKRITVTQEGNDWRGTIEMWGIPRHPSQIYEALSCLLVFAGFLWLWNRKQKQLPEGQLFGMFLIIVFGLRIMYELLKENQVAFEDGLSLNMGQILSIPLVLVGLYLTLVAKPGKQSGAE
jgi:prolipoprotein diacylglyceryltransferase